jgi:hypothetical protein
MAERGTSGYAKSSRSRLCARSTWWPRSSIDTVRINQSNPAERSHQVGLMRKIFESANVVLACLGEDQSNGQWVDVAKRLHDGASDCEKISTKLVRLDQTALYIANHLFVKFSDEHFQADWKALKEGNTLQHLVAKRLDIPGDSHCQESTFAIQRRQKIAPSARSG